MNFKPLSIILFLAAIFSSCQDKSPIPIDTEKEGEEKGAPYEFFFLQRSYPETKLDINTYFNALEEAENQLSEKTELPGFDREWTVRGPGNIGARVNAVEVDPNDENIIYAGFSAGGLFKTINGGNDWMPIFDEQTYLSIGDVTIDPTNSQTIYVGTGDPNISGYPSIGNGVFKSTDGGGTWTHLGLEAQRIVSRILIDPNNPDIVYAACMGIPFERNNDRGLYKSTDGGQSWSQVLFVSNQAGVIDLVMDPSNSEVLYAAGWDRVRNNMESTIEGTGAKIFKTMNGGTDWTMLQGGLPQDTIGRIGLAISQTNPDKVYALYVGLDRNVHNIYLTENGGDTWNPILPGDGSTGFSDSALGGFGWFFGQIRVNPSNDDDIFVLGVQLWRRRSATAFWEMADPWWANYSVHADKHDLLISDEGVLTLATDGGIYQSYDDAQNWIDIENIPTTQFYRVAYNPHRSDWYYGGAQDNGTTGGPNLGVDWPRIRGGDGFQIVFHPENGDWFYSETQNGGISVTNNGGVDWYGARDGIEGGDRENWDMPYIMSSHNPDVLYTGTYRIYKSEAGLFPFWQPISEDLSDGIILNPRFHTITTLYESPVNQGLLYVGTTDGNVWRTQNDGGDWENITNDLPNRYITDVKASADFGDNVYVSLSGYKDNDFTPRIYKSTDRGTTWGAIAGDLPNLAINDIYVLPGHQDTVIFVATDGGVYGTLDGGTDWERLGNNMPMVLNYDMDWNEVRNELVVGTFARGIMSYPLDSLGIEPENNDSTVAVNDIIIQSELLTYPSPAIDFISIKGVDMSIGKNVQLSILDNRGRRVMEDRFTRFELQDKKINIADLTKGLYYVQLKTGRKLQIGKFIKI